MWWCREQVAEFKNTPELKATIPEQEKSEIIAPVKEVEIASLKPVVVGDFPVANIFEKRFVRKFLINYLESIEKGNVTQIKNSLSNNLVIDGVCKYPGRLFKKHLYTYQADIKTAISCTFCG